MLIRKCKPILLKLVATAYTFVALPGLLAAAQVNPSLTPQKAQKPTLPKIDEKACPFEGCQFGPWTATDQVQLFSTWKKDRKPLVTIAKGEAVTAITGVHVTFAPSEIAVTAPMPAYGLKPGDTIYGYMYKGEGVFSAWFNGYWVEDFDGFGIADAGCNRTAAEGCSKKVALSGGWKSKPTTEQPAGRKMQINLLARMRSASDLLDARAINESPLTTYCVCATRDSFTTSALGTAWYRT